MGIQIDERVNDVQRASLGLYGQRLLTGTSVVGEHFIAFTVLTDCVISYTNVAPWNEVLGGDTSQTSLSITAGTTIYGMMTTLSLASGSVMAYIG